MPENENPTRKIIDSEEARAVKSKIKKRRAWFITVAIAAVIFLAVVIGMVTGGYEFFMDCVGIDRYVEVRPVGNELSCTVGTTSLCATTKDTIFIYDENGVSGYSTDGLWKWNTQCAFEKPSLQSYEDFVILTDIDGHLIWGFNSDGILWKYNYDSAVKGVFVSSDLKNMYIIHEAQDFTSAVSEVSIESIISGNPKTKYTRKFVSYHSICVASSNTQVAITGMYTDVNSIKGTVSFLKAEDGSEYASQVMDDDIFVKAFFTGKSSLYMANSDKLVMMRREITSSDDSDTHKIIWDRQGKATELVDIVSLGGKYCVAAYRKANNDTDENISNVMYYNSSGEQVYKFGINGNINGIMASDTTVSLFTDRFVYMFDNKARLIGKYESNFDVKSISYMSDKLLLVQGENKIACVNYKGE